MGDFMDLEYHNLSTQTRPIHDASQVDFSTMNMLIHRLNAELNEISEKYKQYKVQTKRLIQYLNMHNDCLVIDNDDDQLLEEFEKILTTTLPNLHNEKLKLENKLNSIRDENNANLKEIDILQNK